MSQMPLYFEGQLVDINQLSGNNYVQGYPELMTLMGRHVRNPANGYALAPTFIYPLPGKQRIYAQTGRSWKPGTRLRAYRAGNTGDWRTVMVHAYDPATGVLDIQVVASNNFETPRVGAQAWFLTPNFYEVVGTTAAALTTGGTGGFDIDSARAGLALPVNVKYQQWFADFLHNENFISVVTTTNTTDEGVAGTTALSGAALSYGYDNNPGVYRLDAGSGGGNTVRSLQIGRSFLHHWTDFTGDDTLFECGLFITGVSATNYYRMEVGLIGGNGQVKFQFQCSINTQRFQVIHGINGGTTTVNTSVAAVAGSFFKFRFIKAGGNISAFINGANVATLTGSTYSQVTATNRMTPMVRVTSLTGGGLTASADVDYIFYRKQFLNGR